MMKHLLLPAMLLAAGAIAGEPVTSVVKEIHASKLYVYDDDGEEIDVLKAGDVKKEFTSVVVDGKSVEGLPIQHIDDDEGLVRVSLSRYPNPVWIETMSVEIWPGNRLDCPDATLGKSEIEKSGMTIGFGDHCNAKETGGLRGLDDAIDEDAAIVWCGAGGNRHQRGRNVPAAEEGHRQPLLHGHRGIRAGRIDAGELVDPRE